MAKDVKDAGDTIGEALGTIAREVSQSVSGNGHKGVFRGGANGALSGPRGIAAGAVLATAAPIAGRAVKKLVGKRGGADESQGGGPGGVAKAVGKALPGKKGGDAKGGKGQKGAPGVGKGRRMPVQQGVDIAVPLSVAYNQWTQFEEWPEFMHRLVQVTQEDECAVSFKTKVWGMSREFVAKIVEQRPDERIQWDVAQGVTHKGVVTFHELGPRLTRVQVSLDVEPGSWLEKAARGMRTVKRAVRADLARFKAYVEMQEKETGAWRGTIHEGELVAQARQPKRRAGQQKKRPRSNPSRGRGSARKRSSSHV